MSTTVVNQNGASKVKSKVLQKAQEMEVLKTQLTMALKTILTQNLASSLGDKFKHFDIRIAPSGTGIQVNIVAVDDIGRFIYYGTRAHTITSSDAMPLGGGHFAMSVQHPGTASYKAEIDAIVLASVIQARQMASGMARL